ncbi:MAG: DNA photolyase family protein [Cytophagaceae bacterium]|jgi:deoxyribodipyrimidine photo-lyase|nr:DNA photolyase family protein [Cytophagaceae bacterium]
MSHTTLFWFRRDLRLDDNAGLYHALKENPSVLPLFIFDTDILEKLSDKRDARVQFIHQHVTLLKQTLQSMGSDLKVYIGKPVEVLDSLFRKGNIQNIYTNADYEPYALQRDQSVRELAATYGIPLYTFKDQVVFEPTEILNDAGLPYKVYTPYKKKWLSKLTASHLQPYPTDTYCSHFEQVHPEPIGTLADIGFEQSTFSIPPANITQKIISSYDKQRDYPYIPEGTSRLGIHFRFGTISIREKARKALPLNDVWLSELIWREFFMQLLYHFPHVVNAPFQSKFSKVQWRYQEDDFKRWCEGTTGYPLVDAGMRELNQTGQMHNRVRMVVASFLTKHLLIDWRWGEAYFAAKLLDFDLSANNGNWQWCAGTGADAQPYFRIFNPTNQQEKFDPQFIYIKKWVPEFGTPAYPAPMIDHKVAVQRAKEAFLVLKE